ncbi:MAG: type II toxin-antitoxin system VapC family toxin [Actinomycetota bacterium]|nr:type II toxin-antitoxin system VapC family toxin [Actinomycetota bacterium]
MRLLLDTNAVIWWLGRATRLGNAARRTIGAADQVLVSPVTGYEINYKRTIGKLDAPDDLEMQIVRHGFEVLPLSFRHAIEAGDLPLHHRDPFDRLLVAQARCEGLTFVTADRQLDAYGVPILDATS